MTTSTTHTPKKEAMPRRTFLQTMGGAITGALISQGTLSAAQQIRSVGANNRIRIGIIGCGHRGRTAHMEGIYQHVKETNFEIAAICDPWRIAREQAGAMVKNWFGRDAVHCRNYREMLELKDIDAVMIASPDHHHTTHLEAAARAGKHIYVEKPLATEMDRLISAVDAVKAAGTVVQVGTQLRSLPGAVGARDVISGGKLGKISRIEENRHGERPYWYRYIKRDVQASDVDWPEFLGDRPHRPFTPAQYSAWYGYYEFSRGSAAQLGSHFIDMIHFVTGARFPESCVSVGGTFTWKDQHRFTVPDSLQTTWIYPEGFLVTSANNFGNSAGNIRRFYGEKGTLLMDNWAYPTYSAEGGIVRDGSIRGKNDVVQVERPDHYLDWLQCMRTGNTPHAPIEAGYQHAVAVLMASTSYETGRKTMYDPDRRLILTA